MDENTAHEIVDELLTSIEPLETQSAALILFLKAKGIATDVELAPFVEQAGNASSVRWRAVRVRMEALIANAMRSAERKEVTSETTAPDKARESGQTRSSADRRADEEDASAAAPERAVKGDQDDQAAREEEQKAAENSQSSGDTGENERAETSSRGRTEAA